MPDHDTQMDAGPRSDAPLLFRAERVPVLQNRVYASREEALDARHGALEIRYDRSEAFGWNAAFDPKLIEYDDAYDNSVPSQSFLDYYDSIADHLGRKYDLRRGPIVDVGCGKGTFLERLIARQPDVVGIGVDPAYEGPGVAASGRLTFISEQFQQRHIQQTPSLVVCRHTLEHIPDPTSFLRSVLAPLRSSGRPIPLFVEVPDLRWIVARSAFWDFCYEHVNYFTPTSLGRCLSRAGAAVHEVGTAFGDQYLWAEGVINDESPERPPIDESLDLGADYGTSLVRDLDGVFTRLAELGRSRDLVIWGMATKGVMYSMHALQHRIKLAHCVDVNPRKQGRHCPVTGLRIDAPEELEAGSRERPYAVVCMNPNYLAEIQGTCAELGVVAEFFDASLVAPD